MTDVQHLDLLLRLTPAGAWPVDDPESNVYLELTVLAGVLDDQAAQIALLEVEVVPGNEGNLLSRWEQAYAIYRTSGLSDAERAAKVAARRAVVPSFRPADLEAQLTREFFELTIFEPFAFRFDDPDSLMDTHTDVFDGAFVFIVECDEAVARASGFDRDEVQERVDQLKPSHTIGLIRCDDFRFDDPWSLMDRDLLGV